MKVYCGCPIIGMESTFFAGSLCPSAIPEKASARPKTQEHPRPANPGPDSEAALLDAMIEQRLAAKGKRLVDDAQIARLKKAINDLDAALGGLGG